ncbi:MAG: hypothetical protein A3E80_04015 [Chlamydiae bacterium RIFCSPHIGHO2_12_FULL_49_9]|nr:MAG: hypothetical protein A3E80_04015 [Chlamydiae bacterium RIFCSPHIGHO2_12_FULL_49_9]
MLSEQISNGYDPKTIEGLFKREGTRLEPSLIHQLLERVAQRQDFAIAFLILEEPLFNAIDNGPCQLARFLRSYQMSLPPSLFEKGFQKAATNRNLEILTLFLMSPYLKQEGMQDLLPELFQSAFLSAVSSEHSYALELLLQEPWKQHISQNCIDIALLMPGGHPIGIVQILFGALNPLNKKKLPKYLKTALDFHCFKTAKHILSLNDSLIVDSMMRWFIRACQIGDLLKISQMHSLEFLKKMSSEVLKNAYSKIEELIPPLRFDPPEDDFDFYAVDRKLSIARKFAIFCLNSELTRREEAIPIHPQTDASDSV